MKVYPFVPQQINTFIKTLKCQIMLKKQIDRTDRLQRLFAPQNNVYKSANTQKILDSQKFLY